MRLYLLTLTVFLAATLQGADAVVVQPVADMFSSASEDADVVSQAIYATNVAILEESAGWTRIRTPDGYTGWVKSATILKSAAPYPQSAKSVQVSSLFANLYREQDITRHRPVITVPYETRLEVIAEPSAGENRWLQVRLPDDRPAWIQRGDTSPALPRLTVAETLEFGKRFLGLPYTWGGTSTFGYDCSGFTQMLCRRRGLSLPRDAGPQADMEKARAMDKSELQPGDLVFFSSNGKRITHVGMYTGNGEFLNATAFNKPMVQISRLDEPHWAESYVGARRLPTN